MSNVMKIGGKDPGDKVRGIRTSQEGFVMPNDLSMRELLMITPGRAEPIKDTAEDTYDLNEGVAFFGEVDSYLLITGPDLADEFGLTAGTEFNTDEDWFKYLYKGRLCYMAKKPFRYNISWDDIADADTSGIPGEKELVFGSNIIEINGILYRVRLPEGGNAIDNNIEWGFNDDDYGENEWQTIMFNLVDCADDGHLGDFEWENSNGYLYHNDDEGAEDEQGAVGIGGDNDPDGRRSWCQAHEGEDYSRRVTRGSLRASGFDSLSAGTSHSNYGWRPVLEVAQQPKELDL